MNSRSLPLGWVLTSMQRKWWGWVSFTFEHDMGAIATVGGWCMGFDDACVYFNQKLREVVG